MIEPENDICITTGKMTDSKSKVSETLSVFFSLDWVWIELFYKISTLFTLSKSK